MIRQWLWGKGNVHPGWLTRKGSASFGQTICVVPLASGQSSVHLHYGVIWKLFSVFAIGFILSLSTVGAVSSVCLRPALLAHGLGLASSTIWFNTTPVICRQNILLLFIAILIHFLQNLSEQHQCIANVHSMTSAFLFRWSFIHVAILNRLKCPMVSLESQHTIGYGTRYMTEMCPLAYATLSLQCIVGVLLQTVLVIRKTLPIYSIMMLFLGRHCDCQDSEAKEA